jgi:hypothetical protein
VISANSQDINSGPSGSIRIETGWLKVEDSRGEGGNGAIQANSESDTFPGGSISISADEWVALDNSSIATSAAFTSGGDIEIQANDYIDLLESEVTAEVGVVTVAALRGGSVTLASANLVAGVPENFGGNVTLTAASVILDHSVLSAAAPEGSGGNISINAEGFFVDGGDLQEVEDGVFVSGGSRIDISGSLAGGTLQVNAPGTEIIGNLASLSSDFLDVSDLLTEQCALRDAPAGSLIVGGRDRAPVTPGDGLRIFYLGDG